MSTSSTDRPTPDFERAGGLLPVIAQCAETGEVLMLAWMNADAFLETLQTRRAVYYSRSRARLWRKGEESGHYQTVEDIRVDCDGDSILLKVRQIGPACHEGYRSCFFRSVQADGKLQTILERLKAPEDIYKKPN